MYCKYCGKGIDNDSVYCRYCGERISFDDFNKTLNEEACEDTEPAKAEVPKPIPVQSSSRKSYLRVIFAVVAALVLLAGVMIGGFFIGRGSSTNKTIQPKWVLGALDESGEYSESEKAIYTEEMFECRGLSITRDPEACILYRVVFYDDQELYIARSSYLAINVQKYKLVVIRTDKESYESLEVDFF